MPTTFSLVPLVVGRFTEFPLRHFLHGWPTAETVEAPCLAWLIQGDDGSVILVDSGPGDPSARSAQYHARFTRTANQRIDHALQGIDVDPELLTTVILTHLHYDHCADLDRLPNARIYVQKSELEYAVSPRQEHASAYDCGHVGIVPQWMRVFDRIQVVDGAHKLNHGVELLHTPGHSPGSMSVVVTTAQGRLAIAGDLISRVENWRGDGINKPIPPGFFTDLGACHESIVKLAVAADAVLAAHDDRTNPCPVSA